MTCKRFAPALLPSLLTSLLPSLLISLLAACGSQNEEGTADRAPKLAATLTAVNGIASFPGARSQYAVTRTANGYSVRDLSGFTATADVSDARILQFADVKVDLLIGEKAAMIAAADLKALVELYIAYFNRVPEAEGLGFWIDRLRGGQSLDAIGREFFTIGVSYGTLTGYRADMSDADYIALVYKNVLGRSSVDAGGLAYWSNLLNTGKETRSSLVRAVLKVAHDYQGDVSFGWVASLLDNKAVTGNYFAVQQGLSYNTPEESINKTTAIAAAVTASDTVAATRLADTVFGSAGPQVTSSSMTEQQAARLLLQSQFSASDAEIAEVRAKGAAVWLNQQLNAAPGITGWNWLETRGYNVADYSTRYYDQEYPSDRMVWNQLMTAPDPVRKRVALALSEMMVVSVNGVESTWRGASMASYWDALSANAFGSFRTLLEDVSLNPATGRYLNTLGNQKENSAGRQPDENYAREVMQLYTIGIYQLNIDGTPVRDSAGAPVESYGPADVSNLARVFTGYQARLETGTPTIITADNNRSIATTAVVAAPMRLVASQHSLLAASFLGTTIPANTDGATAMRIALDALANHPNVGPFFAKQMIQRLVTSNPSPAYVARVATVFNNNGRGVRGDLKAVFSAILLDEEARGDASFAQSGSGKLREPMLRLVQWGRTFASLTARDRWKLGDYSNPATQLGQSPLRSPSVFNFFRPGYVPPSTAIAQSGRVAPEYQLINESTVGGYLNMMQEVIRNGIYTSNSDASGNTLGGANVAAEYTAELALVTDPAALVKRLNLLLCAGRLSADSQALIVQTLSATAVTATSSASAKLDRVGLAVFLVMASSDYLIQK